ncbi:hypothetical protein D3C76_1639090 [compost metagenome]
MGFAVPFQPVGPVGSRSEIHPAVIPAVAVRRTPIVVRRLGGKQQQIARIAVKGVFAVEHLALALDGQVENIALHAAGAVDKEIQRAVRHDGR